MLCFDDFDMQSNICHKLHPESYDNTVRAALVVITDSVTYSLDASRPISKLLLGISTRIYEDTGLASMTGCAQLIVPPLLTRLSTGTLATLAATEDYKHQATVPSTGQNTSSASLNVTYPKAMSYSD